MDENLMPINEQDDSLLIAALISAEKLNLEEMGRALAEGPEMPVSEEFEARVRACFRAYEKTQTEEERRRKAETRKTHRRKFGRRLFTLVAVLTMLAWALYMTVGAFRTRVNNVVQDISDGIASIKILGGTSGNVSKRAYPGIVPEGYTLVDNSTTAELDYAKYESGNEYFTYLRQWATYPELGAGVVTLEELVLNSVSGNIPAQIGAGENGEYVIVWHTETNFYTIVSTSSQELLISLAESVPVV